MTALRKIGIVLLAAAAWLPASQAQQRYWYDGPVRRPLWAQPDAVADFAAARAGSRQLLRTGVLAKDIPGGSSPVFRDAASDAGAPRALPGGVIVRFPPGTTDAQRQSILARHGVAGARVLGDGSGDAAWLVPAAAGIESLDTANRLYESGDFAAAAPNWWRPRALK